MRSILPTVAARQGVSNDSEGRWADRFGIALAVATLLISGCGRFEYEDLALQRPAPPDLGDDTGLLTSLDGGLEGEPTPTRGRPDAGGDDPLQSCSLGTYDDCSACGDSCAALSRPGAAAHACISGVCRMVSCTAGFRDCDGQEATGCEADLSATDACGGCGRVCDILNAQAACNAGVCELDVCNTGFGDCDGDPENGCERELNSLTNCGGCGVPCSLANATASCVNGFCELSACDNGFDNCDAGAATPEGRYGHHGHGAPTAYGARRKANRVGRMFDWFVGCCLPTRPWSRSVPGEGNWLI
jgi:hypothetical protein